MHLNKIGAWALAGMLAAGSLSLAACSSSKKTTTKAAGSSTTTTAASSSGGGSSSGTSGGSSSGGTSGGSSSGNAVSDAQCVSAAAGYAKVLAAATAAVSGNTAEAKQLQAEYDALGASIPDNLKSDYQNVAKGYAQFEKDIKGASLTDMAKLQKAEADLTNSDFKASADKISAYFNNHCKS
ncbi:MAG TPA: hypothetical protein VMT43_13545 [Acidimicrobiales bacterium]|nr:hypothetical protein [Acidimicrobiales bacterium]